MYRYVAHRLPHLRHQLRVAHMRQTPEEFVRTVMRKTGMYVLLLGVGLAMLVDRFELSWGVWVAGVVAMYLFGFWIGLKQPLIVAHRRAVDIDREVLFAGRFLLVKLHSGRPLINALIEASRSYGVASRYFAEIVHDIELGTPLEQAIENAMTYSASESFRKILFQIHTALRLGIDVTQSLEAVLDDITEQQLLQIQKYGKKLPTVTLFYMLVAIVFPSLGMTILSIILSFTEINMDMTTYLAVLFFLIILNFMFITIFRSIRPKVNI